MRTHCCLHSSRVLLTGCYTACTGAQIETTDKTPHKAVNQWDSAKLTKKMGKSCKVIFSLSCKVIFSCLSVFLSLFSLPLVHV